MSGVGGGDDHNNNNLKRKLSGDDHINLKVKSQEGDEVFFTIKRSTQLKKLMNAYCDRQSVEMNSVAFLFDGRRVRADQTPYKLEMEDGDEIDAVSAQQYVLQAALHEEREVLQTLQAAHQRLDTLEAAQHEHREHSAAMNFRLEELESHVRVLEERLDQSKALVTELEARVRALEERLKPSGGNH